MAISIDGSTGQIFSPEYMMNERIRDLAIQVGAGTPESLYGRSDYIVMTEFELERFSELLIKEERDRCVDILERLHERSGETHNYYLYATKVLKEQ